MLKFIIFSSVSFLFAVTAYAQNVGSCAWAKVSPERRQAFLSAYQTGIQNGMAELNSKDSELTAFVATCTNRSDIPHVWAQGVIASHAIQYGAATTIASAQGIPRTTLDAVWREAPEAARQCTRANAAKAFGIKDQICPHPKAPGWFLQALKMSPTTDLPVVVQALFYFNAKAQSEWEEALIAKFLQTPIKP